MAAPLNRVFNKLQAAVASASSDADAGRKGEAAEPEEQSITEENCVQHILKQWGEGDYLRLLDLPPVEVDALGRPTWTCTEQDISKAYRRLSVFVHPDKPRNRGNSEAREAFERLNEARRLLNNPGRREVEMGKRLEEAKKRRARMEASASVAERVQLNAERSKQATELRKKDSEALANAVIAQTQERQEAARRRKRCLEAQQRRAEAAAVAATSTGGAEQNNPDAEDSSDEDESAQRASELRKRRRRRRT